MTTIKLGTNQADVLAALRRHGRYFRGCGWMWDTYRNTERILDTLVRRGLVTKTDGEYRPVKEG